MSTHEALDILVIHKDPCIRAEKQAHALAGRGHRVHLLCERISHQPNMRRIASSVTQYADLDELGALVRGRSDCRVAHCHNEPNEPTVVALDNASCPVVYDCHDFRGLRQGLQGAEAETERRCFEETVAVVHVSQGMLETAATRYSSRRALVLPSYPVQALAPQTSRDKLEPVHLVYLGGLRDKGSDHYEYRNYHPFFTALTKAGVHVHVYPSDMNPRIISTYMELDAEQELFHLHQRLPYAELIAEISQYQWGLTGFNFADVPDENTRRFLNNALPNKLFDYLLGRVCPVVINNRTSGRYVQELGVGYQAGDADELVRIVRQEPPKPPMRDMGDIDMLRQVTALERLYFELLAAG